AAHLLDRQRPRARLRRLPGGEAPRRPRPRGQPARLPARRPLRSPLRLPRRRVRTPTRTPGAPPMRALPYALLALPLAARLAAAQGGGAATLDIYLIDTEGGQATLFVSPAGESVLVDAGNPGGRDTDRIVATLA